MIYGFEVEEQEIEIIELHMENVGNMVVKSSVGTGQDAVGVTNAHETLP